MEIRKTTLKDLQSLPNLFKEEANHYTNTNVDGMIKSFKQLQNNKD